LVIAWFLQVACLSQTDRPRSVWDKQATKYV
jgi:hypothetical protein